MATLGSANKKRPREEKPPDQWDDSWSLPSKEQDTLWAPVRARLG
jgi:hypothetical protein